MAIVWTEQQRGLVQAAIDAYSVASGKCAALARRILPVARESDPHARGLMIRPKGAARFLAPKHPHARMWQSHTLVGTRKHHVDALTGAEGYEEARYLERYFDYPEALVVELVDAECVDPGIEDVDA